MCGRQKVALVWIVVGLVGAAVHSPLVEMMVGACRKLGFGGRIVEAVGFFPKSLYHWLKMTHLYSLPGLASLPDLLTEGLWGAFYGFAAVLLLRRNGFLGDATSER